MVDWPSIKQAAEKPYLYLGTTNPGKIQEMSALLESLGIEPRTLPSVPDIEENARSYKGNALLKARTLSGLYGVPVISEDSGLGVRALNGAPGLHSGRWTGSTDHNSQSNAEKLLLALQDIADRRAGFVTAAAIADGDNVLTATRRRPGTIATEQRGDKGFSYDTVFIPNGSDRTYAESGDKSDSSRDRAVRAVVGKYLGKQAADMAYEEPQVASNVLRYDRTPVSSKAPLRPQQVFDPALPQTVDPHYTGFLGKLRKVFSRGPGTTTYDTSRYRADRPGDYVFMFGGAGSGVGGTAPDSIDPDKAYGKGNYAAYTWEQVPEALRFAGSLPNGSRIHAFGHSMGATASMDFARQAARKGIPVAGMDLRDAVRINGRLTALEGKLTGNERHASIPSNVSRATHLYNDGWFNNINPFGKRFTHTDAVSLVGQRWNNINGAENRVAPKGMDHKQIGAAVTKAFPVAEGWNRDSGRSSLWRAVQGLKK